ncbi:REP-associated tyrosine transposase [Catenovulum adriaticum]|uniref:Transposase n=1 Tax=Catenovulum adriaticum TaxID=2984846 RepID=A0ABY7AMW9_9ALTE|nr:transposase [Catenovulum sp. TS8]WAJ69805.1 transposase [Catenovulum sp. TS8]
MQYKRCFVPGGCYFFTLVIQQRNKPILTDNIELLRQVYKKMIITRPIETIAMVVLPDHLHAIWQLPEGDFDYSQRWRQVKVNFSRRLPQTESFNASRAHKGERGIWQRRFWEHCIRNDEDLHRHIDYIHYNPVKHGYTKRPFDWPYSSIHQYIRKGILTPEWGVNEHS